MEKGRKEGWRKGEIKSRKGEKMEWEGSRDGGTEEGKNNLEQE